MKTVGVSEAKAHLAQLLDDVERGEEVTITRHGRPVARLVGAKEQPVRDPAAIVAAMDKIRALSSRKGHVDAATLKEWIEYGRE